MWSNNFYNEDKISQTKHCAFCGHSNVFCLSIVSTILLQQLYDNKYIFSLGFTLHLYSNLLHRKSGLKGSIRYNLFHQAYLIKKVTLFSAFESYISSLNYEQKKHNKSG